MLTTAEIQAAVRSAGLSGKPLCVHSSFHSFGPVDGGPDAVIDALMAEGCTVMAPTYSAIYAALPPADPGARPARNGWDYAAGVVPEPHGTRVFTPDSNLGNKGMDVIAATLLQRAGRVRGNHPLNSFTALGPLAEALVGGQAPLDVYAPLRALARLDGQVLLMGVGLDKLTLLHLAEEMAGRNLFRRWYRDSSGVVRQAQVGSCSQGFGQFARALAPLFQVDGVGESSWLIAPAADVLVAAAAAIRRDPEVTHCGDSACLRCQDAVAGGPLV